MKLATHTTTKKQVAIKLVKKASVSTPLKREKLTREITLLQSLSHPRIVALLQVVETSTTIGMVLEYAAGIPTLSH